MPIYEYKCLKCGNRFELRMSINDIDNDSNKTVKCPRCEDREVSRVFSTFAMNSSGESCNAVTST